MSLRVISGRAAIPSLLALVAGLLHAATTQAASLAKVNQTDWWAGVSGLPSYVNMYAYVPDTLAAKPPIVVAPHHCQGTAQSSYSEMASLVSIANKTGFILIFPEATGQNCWDAGSTRSLSHGGAGDTGAVVQMVKYTLGKYSGDAQRVYSVGGSSGGIMTEALLGVYPDVFMAGVSLMGVPCGCWAEGYNDVTGNGSTAQWSGSCSGGSVVKTGQAWGDLVRSYYPAYTGHRPRLQHWHGTADMTLNFKNLAEHVKEWTNLLGLSETPTGTDMPKSGTTRQFWKNACGYTVYETFALSGVAHAVPFDGNAVAAYFGLDVASNADPETAACAGGMGDMGGMGGGDAGRGMGGAAGQATETGGAGAVDGGASGAANVGGAPAGGGLGMAGGGGVPGTSGSGSGGSGAAGGAAPSAGAGPENAGAANRPGGAGQSGAMSGGQAGTAGRSGSGAAARAGAAGSQAVAKGDEQSGCACGVAGRESSRSVWAVAFALGLVASRRRRR